ncbi:MAG TPA: acyl carrier protein [Pirellulales bacterium]|nr:acyl carrier protein [Pirellulales bacterium]
MNESDVTQQLAKLISDVLHETVDPGAPDARLVEDYGANSMDTVDIVERVERRFSVKIANDELASLVTFGDVLAMVLKRSSSNSAAYGNAG